MKKIVYIVLLVLLTGSLSAFAQIQKGNVMIGSNFSNISLDLDKTKEFSLNLSPKAAWFIQDNLALGGYVNLGIQTANGSSTSVNYGVGGLGRYYAGKRTEVLRHGRFFGEVNVGVQGVNVSNGGGHTNGLGLGIGPGFSYFVTPGIGLETLLKYNGVAGFGNAGYQNTLTLNFGLQVYLSGRKVANKIRPDIR